MAIVLASLCWFWSKEKKTHRCAFLTKNKLKKDTKIGVKDLSNFSIAQAIFLFPGSKYFHYVKHLLDFN